MIAYAQLDLHLNTRQVQQELKTFTHKWNQHLNTACYEGSWTVLSLRSPGGKNTTVPDLLGEEFFANTPPMDFFPTVQKLIQRLACPVMAVRFLNLKAGSLIKPHRDVELAYELGEARLHFPIYTNKMVEFYVADDLLSMKEGECWYINANLRHSVTNRGETDRIHLVIDCKVDNWLQEIFKAANKTIKADDADFAKKISTIRELKLQNTPIANLLAAQIEAELNNK